MKYLSWILLILSLINISGCVVPHSANTLAQYGEVVTYSKNDNSENLTMPAHRLKSLTINRKQSVAVTNDKFKHCINKQFVARTIRLTDSRNNEYKYNYRQGYKNSTVTKDYQTKPTVISRTSGTKKIKECPKSITIYTRSKYKVGFDQRFMAYYLSAQNNGLQQIYKFENILRGQIDTGNLANSGANTRVVLTRGEDGINALNALKTEIDQIEDCLNN